MENCTNSEKQHMHSAKYRPNKPVVERKRRERINNSLNQLKALVLEAFNKDETKYSKLEKADILEMTVLHLKTVQKRKLAVASQNDPRVVENYQAGFRECAQEISHYLHQVDQLSAEQKTRVVQHLHHSVQRVHSPVHPAGGPLVHPRVHSPVQQSYYPVATPPMLDRKPLADLSTPRQPLQVIIPGATPPSSLPGGCRSGSPSYVELSSYPSVAHGQYHQLPSSHQVHPSEVITNNQVHPTELANRGSPLSEADSGYHGDFAPIQDSPSRAYSPIVAPAPSVRGVGGGKVQVARDRNVWRPW